VHDRNSYEARQGRVCLHAFVVADADCVCAIAADTNYGGQRCGGVCDEVESIPGYTCKVFDGNPQQRASVRLHRVM
jgi:hypothetical protein